MMDERNREIRCISKDSVGSKSGFSSGMEMRIYIALIVSFRDKTLSIISCKTGRFFVL